MNRALAAVVMLALALGSGSSAATNAGAQSRAVRRDSLKPDSLKRDSLGAGVSAVRTLPPRTRTSMRLLSSLDVWIVERFRGAGLLPDSLTASAAENGGASLARIESARGGNNTDTLFALHFAPRPSPGVFVVGQNVRLAGPTGTIAPLNGIVLARRAFRAPRVPAANGSVAMGDAANDALWRYGWAYLVSLPKSGRATPPATFRGWLLLDGGPLKPAAK